MMNVKSAALKAGVSPGLIYDWVNSGRLRHLRVGREGSRGSIRIDESDLAAFLESLKHGEGPKDSIPPAQKRTIILKHVKVKPSC